MYSMVVLMALTGSAETPDFGRRNSCSCSSSCSSSCRGGGLFGRRSHGCCGSYGGGCYGGGYGCSGGGYGCSGGGYGCSGGGYGCSGGGYYGCSGCAMPGCYGGTVMPPAGPTPMPKPAPKKKTSLDGLAPATIVVSLPGDASLTFDSYKTSSTSGRRVFTSPALTPGKIYSYTLKAQIMRDSKPVTVTREVEVRAGQETIVNLDFPAAVASR
jgi:uncharacterized protein (TIGR03000 family)